MFATPRKLRLNTQTLRQLTSLESAEVVGGTGATCDCTITCDNCPTNTCSCTCHTRTEANEQYCAGGTASARDWTN